MMTERSGGRFEKKKKTDLFRHYKSFSIIDLDIPCTSKNMSDLALPDCHFLFL